MENPTAEQIFEKYFSDFGLLWTQICKDFNLNEGHICPDQAVRADELCIEFSDIISRFIEQNRPQL